MYKLPYYQENDSEVIKAFIETHPFAFLSGCVDNQPVATQIPVFYEERNGEKFLSGHLMKNTDHHKTFVKNSNVLAIFSSPHTYVSATWYSNPHQGSTWNYMSVHARGTIQFLEGEPLREMLRKTTLHFENYDKTSPTYFDNLPDSYINRIMNAIVAFEIKVTEIDTVFKLSQDKDAESYSHIIDKLSQQGESGQMIASEMSKRKSDLFPDSD